MTELETIKRAKMYIDKLANGIDPLTDENINNDSILNNIKISRCLFYVSGVLEKVIKNGGEVQRVSNGQAPFLITEEQVSAIEISETPVGVAIIAKRINAVIDENVKKISPVKISNWLLEEGYLAENIRAGKKEKVAAEKGRELGISTIDGVSPEGITYKKNLYNMNAQKFVIGNIFDIANNVHKQ